MDSQEQVLQAVKEAIERDGRFSGEFEPLEEGMRQEADWWFVPVTLTEVQPVKRRMELYAKFAELESYLQTNRNLQVLLIPVITAKTA